MKKPISRIALLGALIFGMTGCQALQEAVQEEFKPEPDQVVEPEPAHEHSMSEWVIVIEPSCTVDGVKERHCEGCDEANETDIIPTTGHHAAAEWEVVTEPTEETEGLKVIKCTECGEVLESEVIPVLEPEVPPVTLEVKRELTAEDLTILDPEQKVTSYAAYNGNHGDFTSENVLKNTYLDTWDVLQFKAAAGNITTAGEFQVVELVTYSTYDYDNNFTVKIGESESFGTFIKEDTDVMSGTYPCYKFTVTFDFNELVDGNWQVAKTAGTKGAGYVETIRFLG